MTEVLFSVDGVSVTREGPMIVLMMDRGENRVNLDFAKLLDKALARVEEAKGPKALVIASKSDKFFGNGLDVDWMAKNPKEEGLMLPLFWKILGRLLVLDCHTVAAINGHAFGAGFFMALACDWRVMRTERGFLNFPELNLGMRLSKPFAELAKCKLQPAVLRAGILTGKRFGSKDALAMGVIDAECPVDQLMDEAKKVARAHLPEQLKLFRFDAERFRDMKMELYTDAYRALTTGNGNEPPDSRL